MVRLTRKQYLWVNSRGGRDINDVNTDAKGHYLLMSNGVGRQVKIYVPEFRKKVEK